MKEHDSIHLTTWKNPRSKHLFITAESFMVGKKLKALLSDCDKFIIVYDQHNSHTLPNIRNTLLQELQTPVFQKQIKVNTRNKDWSVASEIIQFMLDCGASRKSILIALGGGSIQDPVGFAASVYMRGIRYVVFPTTYMSVFDGVIGKVGVNFSGRKNLVGSFYSPLVTYVVPSYTLTASSDVDMSFLYGVSEVWKEAVITGDEELRKLAAHSVEEKKLVDRDTFQELIRRSMDIKASYVHGDWFDETGRHKALSFGHTIANYLEENLPIHHGEAIMYGMLLETAVSRNRGYITLKRYGTLVKDMQIFIKKFNSHQVVNKLFLSPDFISSLKTDKLSSHNTIKLVLPVGMSYEVKDVSEPDILGAVKKISKYIH